MFGREVRGSVRGFILTFILSNISFLPELDRKTERFMVENGFVKCKHLEGTYLVCELRSAWLNVIR